MRHPLSTLTVCALLLPALSCSLFVGVGDGGYAPTPQRPTFSSDTLTTHPGSLEVEAGASMDPGDDASLPVLLKYGIDEATEAFVGAVVYRFVDVPGFDEDGFGDMIVGARHRFWEDEQSGMAAAAQLYVKVPTADEGLGLGTGETDIFAAGIFSTPFGDGASVTGFLELGLLGDPGGGTDAHQLLAIAPSFAIADDISVFCEFAQFVVDGAPDPAFLTLGLARALEEDMIVDAGVVFGVNDDAPDVSLFVGVTLNLGSAPWSNPEQAAPTTAEASIHGVPVRLR